MERLREEGFETDQSPDEWENFGEIIFRRDEKISVATGETVVIFTRVPELNERLLRQTSDSVVNTYKAKNVAQKALSVLQSTTVYHCLVTTSEQPHGELLDSFITRSGGATFIPVIMVPAINQVLYPNADDRVGSVRPRIEYLQYLLGERRDAVNMHRMTVQAFYVTLLFLVLLIVGIGVSFIA